MGLHGLPDFLAVAQELKTVSEKAIRATGVLNAKVDPNLKKESDRVRACLALTRCEQLLVRSFQPDALALMTPEQLDDSVRKIKSACVQHARWPNIFAPILKRALEAMTFA